MNVHQMFPSRYVTAFDLNGSDVTVTIKTVIMEEMGGQEAEEKPVVIFEKATKGMVLNKTNAMIISGLYGPDTEQWAGKRITIYSAKVKAFGAVHDAIRVRPQVPPKAQHDKPPADPVPEDSGPDLDDDGNDNPFLDGIEPIPH